MTEGQRKVAEWRNDAVKFVVDNFNPEKIEPFQHELLQAVSGTEMREIPRIAMKASKGPGKTTGLAWVGWWAMATRPMLNGACVSVTAENLRDNLWKEFAKWQARSEFLRRAFRWSAKRIVADGYEARWWLSARTWKKASSPQEQADTLAGLHEDNALVIADESGSYPSAVMATADAILSSCKWGLVLQAGNPTQLEGPLYEAAVKHRTMWRVIEVNGDPDSPTRASRVSVKWAREQIEKYGRENPWVLVNVFGQFPPSSINTLLGPEEVERAMKRYGAIVEGDVVYAQKRIGCDTARFGDDPNVLFPRRGRIALSPVTMRNVRGPEIAARVALMRQRWGMGDIAIFIDSTGGYGATLEDSLHLASIPYSPVNHSGKPTDPKFENRRAENWWNMAQWVKDYGALPPELQEIIPELTQVHYTYTSKGKLILESKDHVKEAIGRSPNYADALSLTFSVPEAPNTDTDEGRLLTAAAGGGKVLTEWDPLNGHEN